MKTFLTLRNRLRDTIADNPGLLALYGAALLVAILQLRSVI